MRATVRTLIYPVQLAGRIPLSHWAVILATASLLWAVFDLTAHTLQAG